MKHSIADKQARLATLPRRREQGAAENPVERLEPQRQAPADPGPRIVSEPAVGRASAPHLARDRRRRSEELAHQLAGARDLPELVAIMKEHGRSAVARAAAVRPDLMPEVNGEFAHIALSLADIE
jgi:hypothetical protein